MRNAKIAIMKGAPTLLSKEESVLLSMDQSKLAQHAITKAAHILSSEEEPAEGTEQSHTSATRGVQQQQRGGVCCRHGAKVKTCSHEGCTNNPLKGGVCFKHGAKK